MRLSWNEIRARAAGFAEDWKDAAYEKGETQSFYNDFFEVFGKRRREVARYEQHFVKLDNHSGFIDLFWPGVLLVEQKSAGRDLGKAYEHISTRCQNARFILVRKQGRTPVGWMVSASSLNTTSRSSYFLARDLEARTRRAKVDFGWSLMLAAPCSGRVAARDDTGRKA